MIRSPRLLAVAATAIALFSLPAQAEGEVNVYNWSDYIGETTLADFAAATGITPNYDVYDSNEMLEAKVLAGATGYDIIVPTMQPYFDRMVQAGFLAELDKSQIPNMEHLDPDLMAIVAEVDPGNAHGIIYQWGTNGFGYNEAMIAERMPDAPVGSYAMLFEPDVLKNFADCGVSFLDSASEVYPNLIHYMGGDPNAFTPEDLERATQRLEELKPYIRKFHNSQYIDDLANGEICLAMGWSGDVGQAAYRAEEADNGVSITYTIPNEGTAVWFDILAIPADAPNIQNAHAFINFLLKPETMAEIANYVAYANPVPASLPLMDQEIATDPGVFPPAEVMEKLFLSRTPDQRYERLRSRAWTRVKSGQ